MRKRKKTLKESGKLHRGSDISAEIWTTIEDNEVRNGENVVHAEPKTYTEDGECWAANKVNPGCKV